MKWGFLSYKGRGVIFEITEKIRTVITNSIWRADRPTLYVVLSDSPLA